MKQEHRVRISRPLIKVRLSKPVDLHVLDIEREPGQFIETRVWHSTADEASRQAVSSNANPMRATVVIRIEGNLFNCRSVAVGDETMDSIAPF